MNVSLKLTLLTLRKSDPLRTKGIASSLLRRPLISKIPTLIVIYAPPLFFKINSNNTLEILYLYKNSVSPRQVLSITLSQI